MGLMRNIVVVPYDESWPHAYGREARRIEGAIRRGGKRARR